MSFWSADKLRKKLGNGIISDYDPDRIGRANYKLRMGGQAYVSPEKKAVNGLMLLQIRSENCQNINVMR